MAEVFEIQVQADFSAAHFLEGYSGDCSRTHGHNWNIEVYVTCKKLNVIGIGIDFRDIKQSIKEIIKDFDHCFLNKHPVFKDMNPTSENIARYVYKELGRRINSEHVKVSKVKASESPKTGVFYWEE